MNFHPLGKALLLAYMCGYVDSSLETHTASEGTTLKKTSEETPFSPQPWQPGDSIAAPLKSTAQVQPHCWWLATWLPHVEGGWAGIHGDGPLLPMALQGHRHPAEDLGADLKPRHHFTPKAMILFSQWVSDPSGVFVISLKLWYRLVALSKFTTYLREDFHP